MTLRLPAAEGEALRRMAEQEDRTYTKVVRRALKLYTEQNGYDWPADKKTDAAE